MAQTVKRREAWVRSLGQEDPLEEGMSTYSSVLAWRIPWTEKPGGLPSMGSKSRTRLRDGTFSLSLFTLPGARSPSLGLAHRSVFFQTRFKYYPSSLTSRCHRGCSPHLCSNPMPGSPITLIQRVEGRDAVKHPTKCRAAPPLGIIGPKMSAVLRLRIPAEKCVPRTKGKRV